MQRAVHAVQRVQVDDLTCACLVEVRLPELDPGKYLQVGELASAALDAVEVAVASAAAESVSVFADQRTQMFQQVLRLDCPAGEIEVFGEASAGRPICTARRHIESIRPAAFEGGSPSSTSDDHSVWTCPSPVRPMHPILVARPPRLAGLSA